MKYRKLRIAWSAVCGVLCLLLIISWEESYRVYGAGYGLHYKPYMFRVLLALAGTVVPWFPLLRWRFSLRTLLIGLTVMAVLLGLFFAMSW
jgi:hypothetical protein